MVPAVWRNYIRDKALPNEMGHIIGDYVTAVMP